MERTSFVWKYFVHCQVVWGKSGWTFQRSMSCVQKIGLARLSWESSPPSSVGPRYLLPLTHAGDRSLPRVFLQTISLRTGLFIVVTGVPSQMVGFGNVSPWKKTDQMPDQTPGNLLALICVGFFLCKRRKFSSPKCLVDPYWCFQIFHVKIFWSI